MLTKKPGRPPKGGETMTADIHALATPEMKARLEALAAAKKISAGEYVRRLIAADFARRDKRGKGK